MVATQASEKRSIELDRAFTSKCRGRTPTSTDDAAEGVGGVEARVPARSSPERMSGGRGDEVRAVGTGRSRVERKQGSGDMANCVTGRLERGPLIAARRRRRQLGTLPKGSFATVKAELDQSGTS